MIPQPEIGQPYNPRGYFHFLMVPDPVAGYKKLKQLDKLAYGKLAEYLGHKMNCFYAFMLFISWLFT